MATQAYVQLPPNSTGTKADGWTTATAAQFREPTVIADPSVDQRFPDRGWRGVRGPKSAPVEGNHELFDFLTTEANAVVAPIHPKAMPVILTSSDEADRWLEAETANALALQRPLPDDALRIVAKGEKEDATPQS